MRRLTLSLGLGCVLALAAGCADRDDDDPVPAPALPGAVTVTGVAPASGPDTGGTAVVITGTGFVNGATVTIGGTAATNVVWVGSTTINCDTPSATGAGTATVVVTNPDTGAGTLTNGFTYTSGGTGPTPTFTAIAPASGFAAGGNTVTITGTGFQAGAAVTIGGTAATGVVVVSGTTITATTPAGTPGTANVVITNTDTTTVTGTGVFTYVAAPTISGFVPGNGPQTTGGITVTINGSNFQAGAAVTFNGSAATVTSNTASALEVTLPTSATSGVATVVVTNPDTQSATDSTNFTYDPAPAPATVSPNNGKLAGGDTVTVNGSAFVSGATVTFGGTIATNITFLSATQIQCDVPSGTGAVNVVVANPDGQTGTATGAYTYNPQPTITAIAPNSGTVAGGTSVVITGTGFVNPVTSVTFGGNAGTVTSQSATSITVTTPTGTAGAVNVVVTNPDTQSVTSAGGFTYLAIGTPTVTSVSPNSGTTAGGTPVTITGAGFLTTSVPDFGGTNATNVLVLNDTTIVCTTPAGSAGQVNVNVTNPGPLVGTLVNGWTYTTAGTAPTVSSVSPGTGPAAGGATVTVGGSGFTTPVQSVTIAGLSATLSPGNTASSITITAPAAPKCFAGGAQAVTATNTGGDSGSLASAWTWTANNVESIAAAFNNPDVAVDGSGNIHIVFEGPGSTGGTDIFYTQSTDGGQTWNTNPARLTSSGGNSNSRPRIAANGTGTSVTVVVVWTESTVGVRYDYSTDTGGTWNGVQSLPMNTAARTVGDPDVAIGSTGTVYAAWREHTTGSATSNTAIYAASGTASGLVSATAVLISGGTGSQWQPELDASGASGVVATWLSGASFAGLPTNVRGAWNTGSGWTAVTIHTGTNTLTSASVALNGTNAVAVFSETPSAGTWSVLTYNSTNGGSSWSASGNVLSSATLNAVSSVDIDVDAAGWFTVCYSSAGSSTTDIACAQSSNNGTTWTTPVFNETHANADTLCRVSSGAAGVVHYTWARNNAGTLDIKHW